MGKAKHSRNKPSRNKHATDKSGRFNEASEQPQIPRKRKPVEIKARNERQSEFIQSIHDHDITFGIGSAGTGKTHVAALLAMQYLTERTVDKIVICRPAVPAGGENLGFLPGGIQEKMDPFIQPIFDAFATYWGPQTIKQHLDDKVIEVVPLAFMRGRSFKHTFTIADEMQNATPDNLLMLLTRFGDYSKMVITGDPAQSDRRGQCVFTHAARILENIDDVNFVRFRNEDVVRHQTVRRILEAWENSDNGTAKSEGGEFRPPAFMNAA